MVDIYYQNNYGQKIDMMAWPYKIFESDFLDYEWDYDSSYNAGTFGGKVSSFYRKTGKFSMGLAIAASSAADYKQARDYFLQVAEKDILNMTPGRLYVGEYYLSCYLYGSKKTEWQNMSEFLINQVKIVSEYPAWCKDTKYTYTKQTSGVSEDDYPHDYPLDYLSALEIATLINSHYAPCNIRMIIYGPCEYPSIFMGAHLYQVNTAIAAGEYLQIDTREKTIDLVAVDGSKISKFNDRNRESDVFSPLAPGICNITWSGEFWFDIVLITERSEPEWTI